jgi:hypothetical protein
MREAYTTMSKALSFPRPIVFTREWGQNKPWTGRANGSSTTGDITAQFEGIRNEGSGHLPVL